MRRAALLTMWCVLAGSAFVYGAPLDDGGYIMHGPRRKLEAIEKTYKEISPVKYEASADRWMHLPNTKKRLAEGPALRIVMLGDSIVNDTARSSWVLLLQKRYPKCKVHLTTSVRGSTGCWWYKQPGKVQRYVLDHKPDLVILGGISQRGEIDSIREVMRQIREDSKAEILLMTGAFGKEGAHYKKSDSETIDPKGNDYRAGLRRLAEETDSAFLDMRGAWLAYIRNAAEEGKELEWFMRDPIHANERGEQILGRVLDQFFTPKSSGATE